MTPEGTPAPQTVTALPADQSPSIGKLAGALAKAQGAMAPAKKDSSNPFFKSSYADLASIREAIREPLAVNELAVIQTTRNTSDGNVQVVTTLAHSSGEWIKGSLTIRPVKADPQGIGSALTYARRYALAAIVGVAPDDDDDGNAASGRTQGPQNARNAQNQPRPPQQPQRPQNAPSRPQQAKPQHPQGQPVQGAPMSEAQRKAIWAISKKQNVDPHHVASQVVGHAVGSLNELSSQEASAVIDRLNGKQQQPQNLPPEPPNPF